eukprot:639564-Prymnesium_polylepis.1
MMLSGSLIFFPTDWPFAELYWPLLRPWVHIVPVRSDGSDLRERLDWALAHPAEAEKMAKNTQSLARQLFSCRHLERVTSEVLHSYATRFDDEHEGAPPDAASGWRPWPEATQPEDCSDLRVSGIR